MVKTRLVVGRIEIRERTNISNSYEIPFSRNLTVRTANRRLHEEMSDLTVVVTSGTDFIDECTNNEGTLGEMVCLSYHGIENEAIVIGNVSYNGAKPVSIQVVSLANPTADGKISGYFERRGIPSKVRG